MPSAPFEAAVTSCPARRKTISTTARTLGSSSMTKILAMGGGAEVWVNESWDMVRYHQVMLICWRMGIRAHVP